MGELQEVPPAGTCPPPENAGKKQNNKCAKWVRKTTLFGLPWPVYNYYVFEVVDATGRPTKYYDDYVRWANLNSENPNVALQKESHIVGTGPNQRPHTSFVGPLDPYAGKSKLPPKCPMYADRGSVLVKVFNDAEWLA